mmetsp:Transcript_24986/g.68915  ORF Transcript_24986/g.68915 Transcript_24986/m.68915 type:complete len:715 (-) Transcript_24986:204-2348(-)
MSTLVGGWIAVKKRGRDDELIERDRQLALQRRRDELFAKRVDRKRRRTTAPTPTPPDTQPESDAEAVVSPTPGQRGAKNNVRRDAHSNGGDHHRRRRNRKRKRSSSQRELFPTKTPGSRRDEIERDDGKNLSFQRASRTPKKVADKKKKHSGRNKQPVISRSRNILGYPYRKRNNRIVTPNNIARNPLCDNGRNEPCSSHRRCHINPGYPKALFAKRMHRSYSERTEDDPHDTIKGHGQRKHDRCTRSRDHHESMDTKQKQRQRQQQRQRQRVRIVQPRLQLDFARSAKLFYETIHRNRVTARSRDRERERDRQEPTVATENGRVSWQQSPAIDKGRQLDTRSILSRYLKGSSIRATCAPNTGTKARLLGTSDSSRNRRVVGNSAGSKNAPDKLDTTATKPAETTSSFAAKKEPDWSNVNTKTEQLASQREDVSYSNQPYRVHVGQRSFEDTIKKERDWGNGAFQTERLLSTQGEHSNSKQSYRVGRSRFEQTSGRPTRIKTENNHVEKEPQQRSVDDVLGSDRSVAPLDEDEDENINDDDDNDDDAPPQSQSVSSSAAMLSLPMNATSSCSSARMSLGQEDDDFWDNSHHSIHPHDDDDGGGGGASWNRPRNLPPLSVEPDLLTDLGRWKRIGGGCPEDPGKVNSKSKSQTGASHPRPPSFRQALAGIVLAKNSAAGTTTTTTQGRGAGGMLWLPSILEGGTKHIGLFDDVIE